MTGRQHSVVTIQKMKQRAVGRKHSEETKLKMKLQRLGLKRKPASDETKIKISQALKGQTRTKEQVAKYIHKILESQKLAAQRCKKKVFCPQTNETYDSVISASRALNIGRRSITEILRKRNKQTKCGKTFSYA